MSSPHRFLLFVAGDDATTSDVASKLRDCFREDLGGEIDFRVVDLLRQPELAKQYRILATPTLIKQHPPPPLRVVGDLANIDEVRRLMSLGRRSP